MRYDSLQLLHRRLVFVSVNTMDDAEAKALKKAEKKKRKLEAAAAEGGAKTEV